MLTVFLAGIAVAANRFKVPPAMQILMSDLGANMVTGGWLMSTASVAGMILAIPGAFLLTRLGLKVTGLIALSCAIGGSVVGALATSAQTLLLGRGIEGISIGLISVVSPAAISMWFEPQERGLPMGLWAAWVPVGNVIMFNAAHPLLSAFGWRGVWWFGALLALVALVVYALVVAAPPDLAVRGAERPPETLRCFAAKLPNPSSWLLALAFGAFGFCVIGYNTWAPAYLIETFQIDAASASFYASLMFLAAIVGTVVAGWLTNLTEQRHALLAGTFVGTILLLVGSFHLGSARVVVPYMLLLGFISNLIPTIEFTLAPDTMDSIRYAGLALAIVIVGGNTGSVVGPPALGAVLSGGSWAAGSILLVVVMGVGLASVLLAWRRMKLMPGS